MNADKLLVKSVAAIEPGTPALSDYPTLTPKPADMDRHMQCFAAWRLSEEGEALFARIRQLLIADNIAPDYITATALLTLGTVIAKEIAAMTEPLPGRAH